MANRLLFLKNANYVAKLCPRQSEVTAPRPYLTQSDVPWCWEVNTPKPFKLDENLVVIFASLLGWFTLQRMLRRLFMLRSRASSGSAAVVMMSMILRRRHLFNSAMQKIKSLCLFRLATKWSSNMYLAKTWLQKWIHTSVGIRNTPTEEVPLACGPRACVALDIILARFKGLVEC